MPHTTVDAFTDLSTHHPADWEAAAESCVWNELVEKADINSINEAVAAQYPEILCYNASSGQGWSGGDGIGWSGGDGGWSGGGDGGGGGGGDGGGGGGA